MNNNKANKAQMATPRKPSNEISASHRRAIALTFGKEMKILIQILLIISLPLMGCRESGEVVWTGTQSFMFNGAELKLPNDGKGNFSTSPLELRYDWNGNVLTIKDLGDNTVSVTTPLVKNVIVKKSDLIIISQEGELIKWPPNKK